MHITGSLDAIFLGCMFHKLCALHKWLLTWLKVVNKILQKQGNNPQNFEEQ